MAQIPELEGAILEVICPDLTRVNILNIALGGSSDAASGYQSTVATSVV